MGFNFRAAAESFGFKHEETDTGGTKFPRRVDTTVHHPETGEQVGSARYFPPKRRGGPIHIDDVKTSHPGAGSAVLNEIESRHPGSSMKFLHEVKRNNNNPDKTGHAHERAGAASDWDTHYPNLASTVHRGFSLRLPSHDAKTVNSSANSVDEHLSVLHSAIPQGPAIGTHWTENEYAARQFAHNGVSDHRTDIPVVLHASTPERKDIETRHDHLYRGGVFAYGDEHSPENEVPVRKGRTVKVTGISWRPDASHPDADEHGWVHHTYPEPMHHTAVATEEEDDAGSLDRHDSDVVEPTGPEEPEGATGGETPSSCSYCGSTDFEGLTDNGRVRQATCAACGGTMSAHDGAQWTPELIGDPSNHPSPDPDPRSGGVGGAGAAATDPLVRDHSRLGMAYLAKPGDDEHVEGKMGLPLLTHGESYEDRLGKLTHHYTFLHNDDETNQSYMESRHPLARHHEAHGVPHFDDNDHITEAPDVKARIAAHLSRHLEKNPPKNPPNVSVVLPEHTATMTKHTYADYSPSLGNEYSTSQIRVNRKLARRPEDSPHVPGGSGVPRPSRDWFAADDGSSSLLGRVLTHEHGHLRDEEAHSGISTDDHNHEGIKRREKMFEEVSQHIPGATQYKSGNSTHHWLLDNREHIINHVSTYAAQDDKEFVAELYAHHHHSPNPSKAANVVARYLDGGEHDHGSAHAGEVGNSAVRPAAEGAHPGGGTSNRESRDPAEGSFGGKLAKLTDPEMHEVLTRFGHNHHTGEQHPHREHTVTPVKHAGFKGYVEGYEGEHENNMEEDREVHGSRHPNGGFDEDLWDNTAPSWTTHEREHHEEWGEHPDQDDYDDRHAAAYEKAKQAKEEDVKPVASHGGLHNFLSHHVTDNKFWHEHGEVRDVPLHQGVYATQPHVVDYHVNRYLKNPGDNVFHVHQTGLGRHNENYPGTHMPMFVKHEGNYFTTEGHHRTSSALLRKEPSIKGMVYDADKHGFPHHEGDEDEYGFGSYNAEHGLEKYSSMVMGADCDFEFDDPREAHRHAIRHHDDGVCTATEVARHSEARRNPKEAAVDGPDWCTWRQASQCTFPNDRNNTLLAIPQVRGACPWTTRYQQQLCPISEPGPMALMQHKGAVETHCQTPGAQFHTTISDSNVGLNVDMPRPLNLDEAEATLLESNMHNAMELVLRPYFKEGSIPAGPCDTCKGKGTVSWEDVDPDWEGDSDENPGKIHTAPCDDCDGKGHVPEISDEEIAQQKRDAEERQLVQRQQVSKHVRSEHPDRSKPPTWDEIKSCPRSCPVAQEYSRRRGSLQVTALSKGAAMQREAMPSRNHPAPEGISFDTYDAVAPGNDHPVWKGRGDPFHEEGEETHPGWSHHLMRAHDGASGDQAGTIYYSKTKPGDAAHPALAVHDMKVSEEHRSRGIASTMQDELRRQHPEHMFDHGGRTPKGQKWWGQYDDPGDPKLNLDHPDNAHLKTHYRPTELQQQLSDKDYSYLASLSVPQAYEFAKVARQDPEFGFHVTAAWSDVRSKAKRIRSEGKVMIKVATSEGLAGVVEGDNGAYDNMITYRPGTRKIADWSCDCKWGEWAWKRITFHGRQCSHSLALQYEAQSRGMFGREVHLGALKFGSVEELDELPGLTDVPIQLIAQNLINADEDPADVMKILMAYGLTHSAARQFLLPAKESSIQVEADQEKMCQQCGHMLEEDATHCPVCNAEVKDDFPDTFHDAALHVASKQGAWWDEENDDDETPDHQRDEHGNCRLYPDHEHEHYDEYGEGSKSCPYEGGHTDWDRVHPKLPSEIHRGMSVDLHRAGIHDLVHDSSRPVHERAHALEQHLSDDHIGTHWTDNGEQAKHYTHVNGSGPNAHHTKVVLHADKPHRHEIEEDPDELASGDVIGYGKHEDNEIPLPHGGDVRLKGISWHSGDQWHRHDFGEHKQHIASANMTEAEEDKRRKKHHRTLDTRRHAPNFGYGIPGWIGLPIGDCTQCGSWGCGHCGGTGQVAQDGNGNTANAVPDQNGDEGQMMSGGISETSSLLPRHATGTATPVSFSTADQATTGSTVDDHGLRGVGVAFGTSSLARVHGGRGLSGVDVVREGLDGHVIQPHAQSVEATLATSGDTPGIDVVAGMVEDELGWDLPDRQQPHEAMQVVVFPLVNGSTVPVAAPGTNPHVAGVARSEDDLAKQASGKQEVPTVAGVCLKAADTGRILMLQRGLQDEDDPARGTWENPGGHIEPGDRTSLHAGIREFEEEIGQPFPEGGVVHHTWTSPNGIYQGHVVVIPSEKDLRMHDGRVIPNPDDPKGDNHEQAAWWDIDHARKNRALREELKTGTPWKEIAKAGEQKVASTWDALSGEDDTPGFPYAAPLHSNSENPGSTGWATSEDPKSWTSESEIPDHLLPESSYYGMLHDEPEGALPSTDGADEDGYQPPETQSSIADTESSVLPNQFTGSVNDIVASFQATAGAKGIMADTPTKQSGGEMSFDYTAAARQYLAQDKGLQKSALKDFSFPEQQALINEGKSEDVRARNFDSLQIKGTHYEALSRALGLDSEDPEELFT
jgi:8-oxo-dGTP pyrophosphatase MutT (NUDIX family)